MKFSDDEGFRYKWTTLFLVFILGGAFFNQIWMAFLGGVCFMPMLKELDSDVIQIKITRRKR